MPTDEEEAQGPGGFENFQSYFNANKGTAQAGANALQHQVQGSVNAAGNALNKAQTQFGTESQAGMVGAPSTNVGTNATNRRGTNYDPQSAAHAANGSYTGPGSITDVPDFQNAVATANTAENQLNALSSPVGTGGLAADGSVRGDISTLTAPNNTTPGANNFSANLIGSAGAKQFQQMRGYFNPNKNVANAVTSSAAAGAKAKAQSDANEAAGQRIVNNATQNPNTAAPSGTAGGQIPTDINPFTDPDQYIKKYGYSKYSDAIGQQTQLSDRHTDPNGPR